MIPKYNEIIDDWQLAKVLHEEGNIDHCVFKDVNLTAETQRALEHTYTDCVFLGCALPHGLKRRMKNSLVFPRMHDLIDVFRTSLYMPDSLYEGYRLGQPESYRDCFDGHVYSNYLKLGKRPTNLMVSLARSLHDYSISTALHLFLEKYDERRIVGVMGGHGLLRNEPQYEQVARISKRLCELGSLMISGGGPGAMEATHLGAWMAGRSEEEFAEALALLRTAPAFTDEKWLDTAMEVRRRWPQKDYESLGIPTWLYGHEPSTPLATHIAKYFDNSIREDGILTIAMGGIIYTPGSAGTLQEIFQEAVQNHYMSFGYSSPMCFLDKHFWTEEVPVYSLITELVRKGRYKNLLLTLSDDPEEIIQALMDFRKAEVKG